MRQATIMTLLVSILGLAMLCSNKESLNSLMGRTEIASALDTMWYVVEPVLPDTLPVTFVVLTDSIIWVNEFPSGGSSSLSIIISGQSELDLEVETYSNGATNTVPIARHDMGVFIDTVQIAASYLSEVILTQSSRLFVRNGDQVLDTIQLVNPWSS